MGTNGVDMLAVWSAIALVIRALGLGLLVYVARLQFTEFRYKSDLQPLKRLLFYCVLALIITNIPILVLNYIRIIGESASAGVTSLATVTNATGVLIFAVLLYLVYKYRGNS